MTYPVKWFSSHDASGAAVAGAPVLSGAAGSLITVLDACLLTGYGTVSVASLVVAGGVATATVSAGHGLLDQQIALIAGATPGALNGEQRITRISAAQFSFTTSAADGTAAGVITASVAPVGGWEKSFGGTNLAAYRSTDPAAVPVYYALDDALADRGRLAGYRTMSSVSAGTGRWPSSGYVALPKYVTGSTGGASAGWTLIADSRSVLWLPRALSSGALAFPCYLGDLASVGSGDAWCAAILGARDADGSDPFASGMALARLMAWSSTALASAALPSDASGVAASVDAALVSALGVEASYSGGWGPAYPAPAGVLEYPLHVAHGGAPRGTLRGVRGVAHAASSLTHLQSLAGGTRLALRCYGSTGGSGQTGALLVDLAGPW